MAKHKTYPVAMFAYCGLIEHACIDLLLDKCHNAAVVRRMEGDMNNILTNMGDGLYIIPRAKVEKMLEDAVDMSMNLYTTECPVDNFHFLQNAQPACGIWKKGNVDVKGCKKKLGYKEDCIAIIYPISHLHNKPGNYDRIYSEKNTYNQQKEFIKKVVNAVDNAFSRTTKYRLSYTLRISHKPTNANYWHVTLDIEAPSRSKTIIKKKSKWMSDSDSSILKQIWLNYLIQGFEVNKTSCDAINSSLFIDSEVNSFVRVFSKLMTRIKALNIKV